MTDRISRQRPRTPGEEVGQALVLGKKTNTLGEVSARTHTHTHMAGVSHTRGPSILRVMHTCACVSHSHAPQPPCIDPHTQAFLACCAFRFSFAHVCVCVCVCVSHVGHRAASQAPYSQAVHCG